MLQLKDLPPMEREGNGSLYRMGCKTAPGGGAADQSAL